MPYDGYAHRIEFDIDAALQENAFPLMFAIAAVPTDSNYTTKAGLQTTGAIGWVHYNGGTLHNYANAIWAQINARGVTGVGALRSDGTNIPRPIPPPPPPICVDGTIEVLEMCPDGATWKRRRRCHPQDVWTEETQACPVPECTSGTTEYLEWCPSPYTEIPKRWRNCVNDHWVYGSQVCPTPPAGWDVRTTDLWVREIDAQGAALNSWNILQGQRPIIPASQGYDNIRIDVRLRNYGAEAVSARSICQTVNIPATNTGEIIFTGCQPMSPGQEAVHNHVVPMWTEDVYQRLWVDNCTLPAGNCPAGTPPPWSGCRQGELYDFALSSRHLTRIDLSEVIPPPPPPPPLTCETMFPNRWNFLHIDAYGYVFCVLTKPIYDLAKWTVENSAWIWQPIVTAIGHIKLEVPPFLIDLDKWLKDFPALVTSWLEWFTNPVGKAFEQAAKVGEGLGDALNQVIKVVDPLTTLFSPSRYQTEEIKAFVTPINNVLSRGEFAWDDLISSIFLAPWTYLFESIETKLVTEHATDYTHAKIVSAEVLQIVTDVNLVSLAFDALFSLLPRGIRMLDLVPRSVRALLGGLLAVMSVGSIFGPAISSTVTPPLVREWQSRARPVRPNLGQYLSMRAENLITKERYGQGLAELGLPDEWHERLYSEFLADISFRDLTTLFRRNVISRGKLDELLEVARRDPEWLEYWHELLYEDVSFRMLNTMSIQGQLTEQELSVAITRLGLPEPYKTKLEATLKTAFGRTERRRVLTLFARRVAQDGATEEAYYALADGYHTPREIASLLLQAERLRIAAGEDVTEREASKGMFDAWYKVDIIDGGAYRTGLLALGYDAETITRELTRIDLQKEPPEPPPTEPREATQAMWDAWYMADIIDAAGYRTALEQLRYPHRVIDLQLELLDKRKTPPVEPPPPEKILEATRAMYDTYYMEDIIDSVAWRAYYVTQKYPPDVIDLQLALLDKRKAPVEPPPVDLETERELLESEAIAAFKVHVIDETVLRERLDKLGRSQDAIDVKVATVKAQMAVEKRDATLAVYSKAYRQGAILRSDYLAKLIDNNYVPDAAELIVQTEELSWGTGIETLTQTQILNSWELGFIDDEKVQQRLNAMGLAGTDMRILLSSSVLDQLKAKHLTNPEADKKWLDFGVGPEVRAKLLEWYGWTPT